MKKVFLLATLAVIFAACETNSETRKTNLYTFSADSLCFSYYITDVTGKIQNLFSTEDVICVNIGIQNNSQDSIWAYIGGFGNCYNHDNQLVEELSFYATPDTLQEYKVIYPKGMRKFAQVFKLSVPRDNYLYKNPNVMISIEHRENVEKEYIIPLTINFEVQ